MTIGIPVNTRKRAKPITAFIYHITSEGTSGNPAVQAPNISNGLSISRPANGPNYSAAQISVSDDNGQSVKIASGQVITDMKRMIAKIDVEFETAGRTNKFVGNGDRIHKLK